MANDKKIFEPLGTVGERLAHARELAGYTTAAAAAKAFGWPYSTYAGHENGSRGLKLPTLRGYGAVFNVSFEWLANGKGEPKPRGEGVVADAYRKMSPEDRALYEAMGKQLVERSSQRK